MLPSLLPFKMNAFLHLPRVCRIVLPWRTFYMYSSDPDSCKSWVDILRTKIAPPPTEEYPQQDSLDRSWFSLA